MIEELFDSYEAIEAEDREAEIRVGMSVPTNWKNRRPRPVHMMLESLKAPQ